MTTSATTKKSKEKRTSKIELEIKGNEESQERFRDGRVERGRRRDRHQLTCPSSLSLHIVYLSLFLSFSAFFPPHPSQFNLLLSSWNNGLDRREERGNEKGKEGGREGGSRKIFMTW